MKKIFVVALIILSSNSFYAFADTQTTKVYSNKYIDINLKQPVYSPVNVQDTETVKKIQKTKEAVDSTKKNISDIKTMWGIK